MIVLKKVNTYYVLRCKQFVWLCNESVFTIHIEENSPIGYILEVDLNYPSEFQELHNDYPLASEKVEIVKVLL